MAYTVRMSQWNGCEGTGWQASLTLHVEALQHKQLMIAGLVEEGGEPCLVPNARVRMPILELLVARDHRYPR